MDIFLVVRDNKEAMQVQSRSDTESDTIILTQKWSNLVIFDQIFLLFFIKMFQINQGTIICCFRLRLMRNYGLSLKNPYIWDLGY